MKKIKISLFLLLAVSSVQFFASARRSQGKSAKDAFIESVNIKLADIMDNEKNKEQRVVKMHELGNKTLDVLICYLKNNNKAQAQKFAKVKETMDDRIFFRSQCPCCPVKDKETVIHDYAYDAIDLAMQHLPQQGFQVADVDSSNNQAVKTDKMER